MTVKKLVVEEFEAEGNERPVDIGYRFSYFKDPLTGKYYRPKSSFEVTGENLEDLFEEVYPSS